MGKVFAPSYANIYMSSWEKNAFTKCEKLPSHYFRYLDDIWGIWPFSLEDFEVWVGIMNAHHPNIKIEANIHFSSVDFLDVTTFKGPNFSTTLCLDTKVFFKPTDSHALLHRGSHHPPHTFRGIIKSQLIRFDRICSITSDREDATRTLFRVLRRRGYTRKFLKSAFRHWKNSRRTSRRRLLRGTVIPLVTRYNATASDVLASYKRNLREARPQLPFLDKYTILSAFRRNHNIRDYLVRAKLPHRQAKVGTPRRPIALRNPLTGCSYPLPTHLNTSVCNCIYVIKCTKCGKIYVGETANAMSHRRTTHIYNIRGGVVNSLLTLHFRRHGLRSFVMYPLEHRAFWTDAQRKGRERFWMGRLNTWHPHGLNTK